MFKTLYRCARTAARHENGPAARSRLAHLRKNGRTRHGIDSMAHTIRGFFNTVRRKGGQSQAWALKSRSARVSPGVLAARAVMADNSGRCQHNFLIVKS